MPPSSTPCRRSKLQILLIYYSTVEVAMAQVQIAAQHKGLHCIQPIVSLRSFCPPPVASR